jgi:hypothetical protein
MNDLQKYAVHAAPGPGGIVVKLNNGETFRIDRSLLEDAFDLPHVFAVAVEKDTVVVNTSLGRIRLPERPIRQAIEKKETP